jgi:pimeloyl-ACP methyl ester carboxylesterase
MKIQKCYIDTPHGQLHIRQQGNFSKQQQAPLILFHRSPADSVSCEAVMEALGDYPSIAFDCPGFGGSIDCQLPESVNKTAELFLQVLGQLGIQQFHLLGDHLGAVFAIEIAVIVPDQVLSLSLNGPPLLAQGEMQALALKIRKPQPVDKAGDELLTVWGRLLKISGDQSLSLVLKELLASFSYAEQRPILNGITAKYDVVGRFGQVTAPLIVFYAEDDIFAAHAKQVSEWNTLAKAVMLPPAAVYALQVHSGLIAKHLMSEYDF